MSANSEVASLRARLNAAYLEIGRLKAGESTEMSSNKLLGSANHAVTDITQSSSIVPVAVEKSDFTLTKYSQVPDRELRQLRYEVNYLKNLLSESKKEATAYKDALSMLNNKHKESKQAVGVILDNLMELGYQLEGIGLSHYPFILQPLEAIYMLSSTLSGKKASLDEDDRPTFLIDRSVTAPLFPQYDTGFSSRHPNGVHIRLRPDQPLEGSALNINTVMNKYSISNVRLSASNASKKLEEDLQLAAQVEAIAQENKKKIAKAGKKKSLEVREVINEQIKKIVEPPRPKDRKIPSFFAANGHVDRLSKPKHVSSKNDKEKPTKKKTSEKIPVNDDLSGLTPIKMGYEPIFSPQTPSLNPSGGKKSYNDENKNPEFVLSDTTVISTSTKQSSSNSTPSSSSSSGSYSNSMLLRTLLEDYAKQKSELRQLRQLVIQHARSDESNYPDGHHQKVLSHITKRDHSRSDDDIRNAYSRNNFSEEVSHSKSNYISDSESDDDLYRRTPGQRKYSINKEQNRSLSSSIISEMARDAQVEDTVRTLRFKTKNPNSKLLNQSSRTSASNQDGFIASPDSLNYRSDKSGNQELHESLEFSRSDASFTYDQPHDATYSTIGNLADDSLLAAVKDEAMQRGLLSSPQYQPSMKKSVVSHIASDVTARKKVPLSPLSRKVMDVLQSDQ